jgi:hypothetical protein
MNSRGRFKSSGSSGSSGIGMRRNYLADNLKQKAKELIEKRMTKLKKKSEHLTYESDDVTDNMFLKKVEGQVCIQTLF